MINIYQTEWILEIQNGENPDGPICNERFVVRREDEGGGPFLSIKTENLEPDEIYDANTITINCKQIDSLHDALKKISETLNDEKN